MVSDADVMAEADGLKPSKADKLEAKAAKLRAAEAARLEHPPRARRWTTVLLAGVAVALAAALAVTALQLAHRDDQLAVARHRDAARDGALVAARQYAVDFGSYDYRNLNRNFALVSSHLTPDFAKKYSTISARLKDVIVQYKGRSTAAVQGVAVSQVSADRATVLVFLDQTVTSAQSSTPRVDRNRLEMSLVRRGGGWLISDLALK